MKPENTEKFNDFIKSQLFDMASNSPVIYKYIDLDTGIKAIQNSTLGFTHPLSFNDPYDCSIDFVDFDNVPPWFRKSLIDQYFFHLPEEEKDKMLEKMKDTPDAPVIERLKTEGMKNEIKNRGVSCFSRNYNNILMWSHYAKSHTGICIGFNLLPLYMSIVELSTERMMVLVDYEAEFKSLSYYEYKQESIVRWLKTKAKIWEYEQEIRIVMNHLDFNGTDKYIANIHRECFNSIYFGTNVITENKKSVFDLIQTLMPNIPVFQMQPEKNKFELTAMPYPRQ